MITVRDLVFSYGATSRAGTVEPVVRGLGFEVAQREIFGLLGPSDRDPDAGDDDGVRVREFPLDGLGDDGGFVELLRRRRIETIHSEEATLEDIFVAVTGRRLG